MEEVVDEESVGPIVNDGPMIPERCKRCSTPLARYDGVLADGELNGLVLRRCPFCGLRWDNSRKWKEGWI